MSVQEKLQDLVRSYPKVKIKVKKKKGTCRFSFVVAERKVFLSRKRLTYAARYRVNEEKKEVVFSEMLRETSSGLFGGSGSSMSGYSVNTLSGARKGNISEQSRLFGRKYDYSFDFESVRDRFREIAEENGYGFVYKIF